MKIAAVLSLLLHAAGVALLRHTYQPKEYSRAAAPEPIVLDLQPEAQPEPAPAHQLIDVAVPAETPPDSSERIAETNAEAMDMALRDAEHPAPNLEPDVFDALPSPASVPTPPVEPPSPPSPSAPKKEDSEDDRKPEKEEPRVKLPEPPKPDAPPDSEEGAESEKQPEGPIKIAQAQALMPQRPETGKSRDRGGVSKQGQTNFDAIQSEIAPYLKHVRTKVEQQWNQMLYTRYSGTSPVQTVIDCAINAQGELVSVNVVGTDNDKLYSALCRDAVQRAGPFGPFPFEVPDIYRGKDLEIRWTFSFMVREH
jgi:outer membrane biosynthesis protein TonB